MRIPVLAACLALVASGGACFASALAEDVEDFSSCMTGQTAHVSAICTSDGDRLDRALQICWYPLHHVQQDVVGETYSLDQADAEIKRLTDQSSAALLARLASIPKPTSCQ